jgi:hypothetical protein
MRQTLICMFVLALAAPAPRAHADDDDRSMPGPGTCPATQAWTVFIADATMRRHDGSAKRLSEAHRDAEKAGWEFKDLEVYVENGDLQGFFVTYTRPHPCNAGR